MDTAKPVTSASSRFSTALVVLVQVLTLAACAVSPPDTSPAYRPGVGVVRDVRAPDYQLTVQMDDGTIQRTAGAGAFQVGDRVEITREGRVQKITGAAPVPPPAVAAPAPVITMPLPSTSPQSSAPPIPSYRAGIGVVESASVVSLPSTSSAAAGGASTPTMAYRVKMPDGSTQSVVQPGERFQVGDRVQLTREGRLTRP